MAIYIKGMDMPKNCGECDDMFLLSVIGCDCYEFELNYRPRYCPLTEVAEPHGRLIDADFEESHYRSMIVAPTPDVTIVDKIYADRIATALRMAKTVIEGSEK